MVRTLAALLILLLSVSACDRGQPGDVASQERGDTTGTPESTISTGTPTSTPTPEAAAAADIPPEATAWLKQHAIPFATSKPESGFDDLQPLKRVIGDARIVALGEATHGTREFFEMKHRLLEFLVKEMGFNTFAIEATWPESNLVNDYVHTGEGDPAKLLSGLYFWTWNTQEVLDMILWMRRHNEDPGDAPKVSFFGFDMQQPRMAMQNVVDYLKPLDAGAAERAASRYSCLLFNRGSYAGLGATMKEECRQSFQAVYDELATWQADLEARSSPAAYAGALQSARVALQAEALFSAGMTAAASQIRDQAMADNAAWLLEQAGPDAKIVLWAHNGHVRNEPGWMGSHLRERFGSQMVIVGFDFYGGSFNAVQYKAGRPAGGLGLHQVEPPPADSHEGYFHSAGVPRMILDLRRVDSTAPATRWLAGPRWMRAIGAVYDKDQPANFAYFARLPAEYDVIIYFEETTPSVLLPFR
jgi:erythromycin esterase